MIVKKRWKDIPPISEKLWSELQPLKAFGIDVYLASATLLDGVVVPCVMFVEKNTSYQQNLFPVCGFIWRKHKCDDEHMIDAASVIQASPSPYALPPKIGLMLDEHGHYDDPISHARLRLRDGREYWIRKSWPGLFVGVPNGYSSLDITGVAEWATQAFYEVDKEISDSVVDPPPYKFCILRRPNIG